MQQKWQASNISTNAKRTTSHARSSPKTMRNEKRRVAPVRARWEMRKHDFKNNIYYNNHKNEQHNMHCASETYRINLVERPKRSAESESALLKSEGEMGSAQKIKWTWNINHNQVCALKKIMRNTPNRETNPTTIIIAIVKMQKQWPLHSTPVLRSRREIQF